MQTNLIRKSVFVIKNKNVLNKIVRCWTYNKAIPRTRNVSDGLKCLLGKISREVFFKVLSVVLFTTWYRRNIDLPAG